MLSSVVDLAFELVNYLAWVLTAMGGGEFLHNLGSSI
ncbi:hypothetical protein CCYS_13155 [Corynebacterium cystitidis DSM 20524]|nr:hypothetical protein CCYS_13155 [Corynebacterium cystitidis DSM 20524]SNV92368.1 Uncharacterised protein [Corynebacterium cystitidis]